MTDDDRTDEPDSRDEILAARLEVAPLDVVTRRRLVRRALAEGGSARARPTTRILQVAAVAAAAVIVAGTATLVLREDGAKSRDAAETGAGSAADAPAEALGAASEGLTDLGEVADPAVLLQRLEAARVSEPGPTATTDTARDAEASGLAPACRAALEGLGAGPPTFTATATYAGSPAVVVVAPVASGDTPPVATAVVLDAATCTPLDTVGLA